MNPLSSAARRLCVSLLTIAALFGVRPGVFGQTPPALSLQLSNNSARLRVTGDVGSPGAVQYTTSLAATNSWALLSNYTLLSASSLILDPAGSTNSPRYYRTVTVVPANMIWVPAGFFSMGSPTNELERGTNEVRHTVTLTKGFYMGKYLVTQSNYLSLINTNPSFFKTNSPDQGRPVEQVSWFDATNYCSRLTQQERAAGRIFTNWAYRLPTEAEWEYACRAGTTNAFYYGTNLLSGMANFDGEYEYLGGIGSRYNSGGVLLNRTTTVGSYQPNAWGLFDMTANVWEWCQDWFGNYPTGSVADPQGPATGSARVFRGGALNATGRYCRAAYRDSYNPAFGFNTVGFRVVLAYGP